MRVLLLGATGQVGSRLLPALLAHGHTVVVYVRTPSKIPKQVASRVTAIISGSGTNSNAIKGAILSHSCDAVINAAGFAPVFSSCGKFPAIFSAVSRAAQEAKEQRGGSPLRCWFLSGWPIMDSPKNPYLIMDYAPIYRNHRTNYHGIRSVSSDQMAWSLFCASNMPPRATEIDYAPQAGISAHTIQATANAPGAWSRTLSWVPFLGTYLNILVQTQSYYTPLEDCVDFIAGDLSEGLDSQWIGKRVGVKTR